MPEQEKQQLSRDVAEKYGIDAFTRPFEVWDYKTEEPLDWLHGDSARCFDLMVEHELNLAIDEDAVSVNKFGTVKLLAFELFKDHTTKQEATRIAILKALLAKK